MLTQTSESPAIRMNANALISLFQGNQMRIKKYIDEAINI
jgi:hypothetical protein